MNKQTALTWKYFWQQKWEEILGMVESFGPLIGVLFVMIIMVMAQYNPINWQGIMVIVLFILLISGVSCYFVYSFHKWIKSNWKEASARAKKKIKKSQWSRAKSVEIKKNGR